MPKARQRDPHEVPHDQREAGGQRSLQQPDRRIADPARARSAGRKRR